MVWCLIANSDTGYARQTSGATGDVPIVLPDIGAPLAAELRPDNQGSNTSCLSSVSSVSRRRRSHMIAQPACVRSHVGTPRSSDSASHNRSNRPICFQLSHLGRRSMSGHVELRSWLPVPCGSGPDSCNQVRRISAAPRTGHPAGDCHSSRRMCEDRSIQAPDRKVDRCRFAC